jgi:hypothetical protein
MNDSSQTSGPHLPNPAAPEHSTYRASHADREQTAIRLRRAAGEGRLFTDELERRLEAAFQARTHGELDLLICDLPTDRGPDRRRCLAEFIPVPVTAAIALAVAALITLVLIAAMAGIGFRRSGAAASNQPHPPIGLSAVGR